MNAKAMIESLALEPHVEGGFFRRCYQSDHRPAVATPHGNRFSMTAIYYMLTRERPVGYFHKNRSDIMHVHCTGLALRYYLIDDKRRFSTFVLGSDVSKGQQLQRVVEGGTWKATELIYSDRADDEAMIKAGSIEDYGLLTEVVVPGFSYEDMTLASREELLQLCPEQSAIIERLVKP